MSPKDASLASGVAAQFGLDIELGKSRETAESVSSIRQDYCERYGGRKRLTQTIFVGTCQRILVGRYDAVFLNCSARDTDNTNK